MIPRNRSPNGWTAPWRAHSSAGITRPPRRSAAESRRRWASSCDPAVATVISYDGVNEAMVRPASSPALRISLRCSAYSSGSIWCVGSQPSPYRPASRRVFGPCAATQIGGYVPRYGPRPMTPRSRRKYVPSYETYPGDVHRSRITYSASSRRDTCPANESPYGSTFSRSPAPIPSTNRPCDRWCSVSAAWAISAGWRRMASVTAVPTRAFFVRPASHVRNANDSKFSSGFRMSRAAGKFRWFHTSRGASHIQWSGVQNDSAPATSSPRATAASTAAGGRPRICTPTPIPVAMTTERYTPDRTPASGRVGRAGSVLRRGDDDQGRGRDVPEPFDGRGLRHRVGVVLDRERVHRALGDLPQPVVRVRN